MKSSLRMRADKIKKHRCKNVIAVLENPNNVLNVGSAIRNVNALGIDRMYVVDSRSVIPDEWESMREHRKLSKTSASAIKWSFVKKFRTTSDCLQHLMKKNAVSMVTSPHVKGRTNLDVCDVDYTKHKVLAVWFGSENIGISDEVVCNSTLCINIPMFGIIESLNLGTTTGIVLHEVARQRRAFQEDLRNK